MLYQSCEKSFLVDNTDQPCSCVFERMGLSTVHMSNVHLQVDNKPASSSDYNLIPYKMKIWHRIYFGGLANYKNPPN